MMQPPGRIEGVFELAPGNAPRSVNGGADSGQRALVQSRTGRGVAVIQKPPSLRHRPDPLDISGEVDGLERLGVHRFRDDYSVVIIEDA